MRKLQLLSLLVVLTSASFAQVASNYTFSSSTNTYNTTLTGATTLIPSGWSSQVANVPLPFVFYFNGKGYSSVWVNSNGFITFGATPPYASTNNPLANNNGFDGSVSAFGLVNPGASAGLVDATNNAAHAITYGTQTSGANTAFVIQWGNAYRWPTRPGGGYDSIKFQIRLIQNTNVVEIMYGACATNIGYTFANLWSPVVGLGGSSSTDFNNRSTTTTGAWTTTGTSAGASPSDYLLFTSGGSVPPSGLTMDWTPTSSPTVFSGTPPVATAVANAGATCSSIHLSLAGLPFNTGFTYQWQKSATGLPGSWVNCTGTGNTTATCTETPAAATYYQCLVTGGSGTTASTSVAVGRESACPGTPTYTYNGWYNTEYNGYGFNLTSFSVPSGECGTSINDIDASQPGYNQGYTTGTCDNYIDLTYLSPIKMYAGNTYTGTLTDGYTNAMNAKIYIDFNDNGVFTDAGEQVASVGTIINSSSNNVSIAVPAVGSGAYYGLHRMRIRAAYSTVTSPIGNLATYGMAKDYLVSILPPNQTITPSLASPLCLPVTQEVFTSTANISTGTPAASTYTYTWSGPSAFTTTAISSANTMSFAPTSTAYSGIYSVVATADGSQACSTSTYNLVVATTASAPAAAPTGLSITNVNYHGATISFTPYATVPDGYLVVATNSATAPTAPTNGTTYATGATGAFGANSVVINGSVYGSAPSYTTTALSSNSQYYIYIYPFNIDCSGPKYYAGAPALPGNSLITCIAPPTGLTATSPTGSSINLSWTAAISGGNTSQYVNPATFTYTINAYLDATLTIEAAGYPVTVTSTSYVASGLGVGTAYYFVVTSGAPTATCGTNSNTASNTTTCSGTASIPYIQNFETGSSYNNISPNCWTGNTGTYSGIGGEYKNGGGLGAPFAPHSGSWYYVFMGNNYLSSATYANQWLVSPGFTLNPGTYTFSFWYVTNSQWSTLKAEYSTTGTVPANTASDMTGGTVIGTPPTNFNVGSWTHYSSTVTIATGGTYYFGIDAVMGATPVNLQLAIDDIEICTPPNMNASNTGPYCSPATVSLSSSGSTGALQYAWSGPSSYSASTANATASGITTGNYVYTVTGVADPISAGFSGACASVATTTVSVNGLPTAIAPTVTPNPLCVGSTITLNGGVTGGNGLIYSWSGPTTGITDATVVNATIPSAVSGNAGTYSLTTTVSGCSGTMTGATSSALVVNSLPSALTASVTPNPVCQGGTTNLNGTPTGGVGVQYAWSGPTTGISNANAQNTTIPIAVSANAGTFTLTATSPTCSGSVTATTNALVVNALPTSVSPSVSPNPVCVGSTISLNGGVSGGSGLVYSWSGPTTGITSASVQNATINSAVSGNAGTYTLTVTAPGCVSYSQGNTNATPLVVNQLPSSFTVVNANPNPVCVGSSISLTAAASGGSGATYAWTGPGTSTIINPTSLTTASITAVALADAGSYTVTASAAGCTGTTAGTTSALTINQLPSAVTASVTPNPVCVGNAVTLQGNNTSGTGVQYAWTGPVTGHISSANAENASISSATLTDAGVYTLTATAPACAGSTTATSAALTVNQLPASFIVNATPSPVCVGSSISLTATPSGGSGATYMWTGPGTSTIVNPTSLTTASITAVTLADAGAYTITATAAGCIGSATQATGDLVVHVLPTTVTASATPNPTCVGNIVTLTGGDSGDGVGVQYAWTGPNTADIASASAESTSVNAAALADAGVYTLTATAPACAGSTVGTSSALVVNLLPTWVTADVSPNPACVSGSLTLTGNDAGDGVGVQYAWTGPVTADITSASSESASVPSVTTSDAGIYTLTATAPGCAGSTAGTSSALVVNTPPTAVMPAAAPNPICVGNPITLTGNVTGGTALSYSWSGPTSGIVNASAENTTINSATLANNGTFTLTVTAAGCAPVSGSTSTQVVNALPVIHTFTGGGSYCVGDAGVHIGLTLSDTGISYQLYLGGSPVGGPVAGTGSAIDFGVFADTGVYHAIATNVHTTCTSYLSGVTVHLNPLPDVFNVTGGGSYCASGAGMSVGLDGSATGISYQLYNGTSPVSSLAGTGVALDFGAQTAAGPYSVIATNTVTGCSQSMNDTVAVTIIPLPTDYAMTGGGGYCAGDTGVHVGLANSDAGTQYQLYYNGGPDGSFVTGTGAALDFGLQTNGGTYSVIATNPVTTCVTAMTASVTVTPNPLPTPYDITIVNGGNYCSADTGVHIGLSHSDPGIRYQLYKGAAGIGSPIDGTGTAIDFGLYTVADTYRVVATDTLTHCMNAMNDSAVITITTTVHPTAAISTGIGTGDTVCTGSLITFTGQTHNGGTAADYTWFVNGSNVSSGTLDSTYNYVPVAGDIIRVVMTSSAACAAPPTVHDTMLIHTEDPLPPSVFIIVRPLTAISIGQPDTLIAIPTNCGSSPQFQWYKNGSAIAGATNAVYTSSAFANGDSVSCVVITSGPCGGQMTYNSVIISVYPAGVIQVSGNSSDIRLIPNPNKGTFAVKGTLSTATDETVNLEITDMLGQVVYRSKTNTHNGVIDEQIQLPNLANGMYILNLQSTSDHKVFHFVIEQ